MATKFQIEDGVEIPPKRNSRGSKYPWSALKVEQSFFVPGVTTKTFNSQATAAAKRLNIKLTVREMDGGVRIWRIA